MKIIKKACNRLLQIIIISLLLTFLMACGGRDFSMPGKDANQSGKETSHSEEDVNKLGDGDIRKVFFNGGIT